MMHVNLNDIEYNYLLTALFINDNLKKVISCSRRKGEGSHIIMIQENESEELRDILGEQLQLVGFDEHYNPTTEGEILESLIDKFFWDVIGNQTGVDSGYGRCLL